MSQISPTFFSFGMRKRDHLFYLVVHVLLDQLFVLVESVSAELLLSSSGTCLAARQIGRVLRPEIIMIGDS